MTIAKQEFSRITSGLLVTRFVGSIKAALRQTLHTLGLGIRRYRPPYPTGCASLSTSATNPRGNVLVAYILEPFLRSPSEPISTAHTHFGESLLIAEAFLEIGYNVDVIDYRNGDFRPRKQYDLFVSARTNLEHIGRRLNPDCIKIAHLDTSHYLFNNQAAYARALALQRRRGVTCESIRVIESNLAIEHADYGALLGDAATVETYAYANKPLFCLPAPCVTTYAFPDDKNYDTCRRRFLWFGSGGLVHKGLDLVLEAFAELPQHELVVCGPIESELTFSAIYKRELYDLPNVRTVGWVDVTQQQFIDIANTCVALIYPTCAEGLSTSSLTCMHAGIIPILSREAGIELGDCGILLRESTIEEIRERVIALSELGAPELERMTRCAWDYARARHTKERYGIEYKRMINQILEDSERRQRSTSLSIL